MSAIINRIGRMVGVVACVVCIGLSPALAQNGPGKISPPPGAPKTDFSPDQISDLMADEEIPQEFKEILEQLDQVDMLDTPSGMDQAGTAGKPDMNFDGYAQITGGASLETAIIDHLQLKDMDIIDVLKLLSQKSGLNIIAGNGVSGKVSIYLKQVKLQDVLRIILDSNSLAYKEENGIIRVMPANEFETRYGFVFGGQIHTRVVHLIYARAQDILPVLDQLKSSAGKIIIDENSNTLILMDTDEKIDMMTNLLVEIDVPVEIQVFDLHYANAKELMEKIEPVLTEGVGSLKYDERSNKIIVRDVSDKMDQVRKLVAAFDVQVQQVFIEAKIVQIELTDTYELGVNWQAIFSGLDNLDVQTDFDVIDTTETNKGSLSVGAISAHNYTATLEALKKIGKTNILSSPSITALNNQEAKILVGSTQPYVTTTTTTSSGVATTAESINFIDVGVKLYVTPTIHKDGFITMNIRPEVSSVLGNLETSGGNDIPIVKTSEAETMVRIKDGVTIVIGGLIEDSRSDTKKRVPLLGDIPLLGAAFRNRDESTTKTEIAIFLTPRIVTGEESIDPDLSQFSDNNESK